MKKIAFLITFFLSIGHLCFSQTADINLDDIEIFPSSGSEIENGRVVLYNTGQPVIPYNVLVRIKRKTTGSVFPLEGTMYYQYMKVIDDFKYNQEPFDQNSLYSPLYEKTINIPSNAPKLDSIRAQAWSPNVPYSPYQFSKKGIQIKIVDVANFIGPKQICNEATYTIERPGTITLENAGGVATLTSLGNNQWKVTRIGNAVGTVNLRSTSNGKVFSFPILVNSNMNGTIDGPVGIKQGWDDNYFYFTPEPGMDYNNVTWSVDSPHLITTQVDRYTFKISVPTNYPLMDKAKGDDVEIYIRSNGSCGVMEKSRTLRIIPARPIKN